MTRANSGRMTVFATLLAVSASANSANYWGFRDAAIDVTAEGPEQYGVNVAHNLHRLDAAMVKVLPFELGKWRPPTHIYAISPSQTEKIEAIRDSVGTFTSSGFDNDILIVTGREQERPYWGAYFGYSGSLLMSEGKLRYPYWYQIGISEVFAASAIESKRVKIGGFMNWQTQSLYTHTLIPMRTLLRLRADDPQLRVTSARVVYEAECWFLAHQILIERAYHAEFSKYLSLVSDGQKEDDAFAESFKISYEDLDKFLAEALRSGKIKELLVEVPDDAPTTKPRALSAAEMKGRVAYYASRHGHDDDYAANLAADSLTAEPNNEHALRAMAWVRIRQGKYKEALETVDRLAASSSLSAQGFADNAATLWAIATAVTQKKATLGSDAPTLLHRARESYEHAIALDGENLAYWAGLVELIGAQHDVVGAKEALPKAEQLFYRHPLNGKLARAIASMCGDTENYDDAFKFAVAWQKNAMNDADRDYAGAYMSRLKARAEKRDAIGAARKE